MSAHDIPPPYTSGSTASVHGSKLEKGSHDSGSIVQSADDDIELHVYKDKYGSSHYNDIVLDRTKQTTEYYLEFPVKWSGSASKMMFTGTDGSSTTLKKTRWWGQAHEFRTMGGSMYKWRCNGVLSTNWRLLNSSSNDEVIAHWRKTEWAKKKGGVLTIKSKSYTTPAWTTLGTNVDPSSEEFKARAKDLQALEDHLATVRTKVQLGGGEKARDKVKKAGKLLVRERPFLELSEFAAHEMYGGEVPCAAIVTGIGRINGTECMIVANDATVKGGVYHPITVKKHLRAQEIAKENKLPCVYLVESGGAALPYQADVFPDVNHFGRIFYNMANLSAAAIPQLAVVHGISVAGGAYVPAMADENIIVKNQGTIFLAGPPLVKAALGEEVDSETLGGGLMHATESGVVDHLAINDSHALSIARSAVSSLHYKPLPFESPYGVPRAREEVKEPVHDPEELGGIVGTDLKKSWDMREVIARTVDGSRFHEWKREFGPTVVTGFAEIHGYPVGIVANNGILLSPSALKATQFIQLCEQRGIPLVFLVNISGFMVGTAAEKGGIAKNGAKMVRAVATTTVPKFTIMVGGGYGAGNYGMSGRAYSPRFLWSWPNSRVSVMGADQLQSVMSTVSKDTEKTLKLKDQIEHESTALYGSARLWDDGIIAPKDTRNVLGLGLAVAMKSWDPKHRERGNMGVFRM
ncbi:3-methylcrotonyl-CoA carboxylase beta subunit [Pseudohyphozyma bogoriensis]|nr:3-methylcrotonyl-CoA carboxylase beta subunit [Pseudohyphozyma bogoriensis]